MFKVNRLNEKLWRENFKKAKSEIYKPNVSSDAYNGFYYNNIQRLSEAGSSVIPLNTGVANVGDIVKIYLQYPNREIYRRSRGEVMSIYNGFLVIKPLEEFTYTATSDDSEYLLYFPSGIPTHYANKNSKAIFKGNPSYVRNLDSFMSFLEKNVTKTNKDAKRIESAIAKYIHHRLELPSSDQKYLESIAKDIQYEIDNYKFRRLSSLQYAKDLLTIFINGLNVNISKIWDWYSFAIENNIKYKILQFHSMYHANAIELISIFVSVDPADMKEYYSRMLNILKIGKANNYQDYIPIPEDGVLNKELLKKGDKFLYYDSVNYTIKEDIVAAHFDFRGLRFYFLKGQKKYFPIFSQSGFHIFSAWNFTNPNPVVKNFKQAIENSIYQMENADFDTISKLKSLEPQMLNRFRKFYEQ